MKFEDIKNGMFVTITRVPTEEELKRAGLVCSPSDGEYLSKVMNVCDFKVIGVCMTPNKSILLEGSGAAPKRIAIPPEILEEAIRKAEPVKISVPKEVLEQIVNVANEIHHPFIEYNGDLLSMSNKALESCKVKAYRIVDLLNSVGVY